MQISFWCIMAIAAIVPFVTSAFLVVRWPNAGNWCGRVVGELLFNNNARAATLFIVAILMTVAAIAGGRGKPLLTDELSSVKAKVKEAGSSESLKNFLMRIATNDGEVKIITRPEAKATPTVPVKASAKKTESKPVESPAEEFFPSWWNWLVAIIVWLIAFAYLPIAFSDEVGRSVHRVLERRKTAKAEATAGTATDTTTTASAPAPERPGRSTVPMVGRLPIWLWSIIEFGIEIVAEFLGEIGGKVIGKVAAR